MSSGSKVTRDARPMLKHPPMVYARYAANWSAGLATWWRRALPDFVVIGAQKSGTTSLYSYLVQHPQVLPALRKGLHYFDLNDRFGLWWYRSHFPTVSDLKEVAAREGRAITGEASPYYMYHPQAASRFAEVLPDARVIVILRDPIQRAFSNFHHERRSGHETRTFEAAIDAELEQLRAGTPLTAYEHRHFSYVARGHYAEQLEHWWSYVSRERTLILRAEALFQEPGEVLSQAYAFLGLRAELPASYPAFNAGDYNRTVPENARARLAEHFTPWNARLAALTGIDFGW